jgi:hypothetical protein
LAELKYRAFVSFSHEADEKLAVALQSSLSRFAKPWYRTRSMRVFQDEASLAANPALWDSIQQALAQSEFLLLLASPASAWLCRDTPQSDHPGGPRISGSNHAAGDWQCRVHWMPAK